MEYIIHLVSHYGYLAIFILLAPGIFGIPLPDELLLTFAGYLALQGDLQLLPTLAVVVTGAILGITVDYWLGRAVGANFLKEPGAWLRLKPDRSKRLQAQLRQYGGWVLGPGYFVPGVRHWVAIAAGAARFPLAGFALSAYTGALAWSLVYIFLGYYLGQEAGRLAERLGAHCQMAIGLIAALLLGYALIRGKCLLWPRWPKISGKLSTGYSLKR
jgi:membrane protein DedA with SNARE-associated domain